ncbi:hypothetical protein [Vibrio splendidus]|uniref:hypothetical protein n=1 Tax=Vibrio splendidus TaxID=29497 RepID=UPI000769A22A|nr:hypothetical protein [Vibrio splendidus]
MGIFSNLMKEKISGKQFVHNGIHVCSHLTEMYQKNQFRVSPNNPETGAIDEIDLVVEMHMNINELAIKEMVVGANPYLNQAFEFYRSGDTMSALLNISDAIVSFEGWQNHVIPEADFYDKYDLLVEQFSQLLEIIQKVNSQKAVFIKD